MFYYFQVIIHRGYVLMDTRCMSLQMEMKHGKHLSLQTESQLQQRKLSIYQSFIPSCSVDVIERTI